MVSVQRVPITFSVNEGKGTLKIADAAFAGLEPYRGPDGKITTLTDTIFSTVPGAPVFVGKATRYRSKNADLGHNLDISGFNAQAQVVLTAMKHYGLIVADNGSNWYFQGTMDAGWNSEPYATMVSQLKTVPATAFEALDESSLMVDPNSGRAFAHPRCASAALSPLNPSPPAGSTVTFSAAASVCPMAQFEFWVGYPNGSWVIKQAWGGAAFNWDTTGLAVGSYQIHVWANQIGASTASFETYGTGVVTLSVKCVTAALTPPSQSAAAGATVPVTATSTGCATPQYEFWVGYPNGSWVMKQAFGGASFNWNTAGLAPGAYQVHVWANNIGDSTASWEAFGAATVTLTGCTSATLSPASSSGAVGVPVTFTASSTVCSPAVYQFYLQDTAGVWHLEQAFSTGTMWTWTTTGLVKGVYHVHVWANQQGADTSIYEAFGSATYTLN